MLIGKVEAARVGVIDIMSNSDMEEKTPDLYLRRTELLYNCRNHCIFSIFHKRVMLTSMAYFVFAPIIANILYLIMVNATYSKYIKEKELLVTHHKVTMFCFFTLKLF
jgi:hypothetical protein